MNFLSHYYFDKNNENSYEILGSLLPDLIKNADKSWNIHPEKKDILIYDKIQHQQIIKGWKKHLMIDRIFHNTDFFFHHQHQIKLEIKKNLDNDIIKPFFVGHISLELILDHLLIVKNEIVVNNLYLHLEKVDLNEIADFLKISGIEDTEKFYKFFDNFRRQKYLHSYEQVENITYAIKGICKRIWENPFTKSEEIVLSNIIVNYIGSIESDFKSIFKEIDNQL
jgi:acyl carrier protein phosphodiesterase